MADIELIDVHKSYGRAAVVHGVDLRIADGEFVVILGPSGCGKSTLLRMVAGLETITAGQIRIAGRVVNRLEPRERGCAMVFQNYSLYPHMTVAENIGYALRVAGVAKAERRARVEAVAATVGLSEFLDRKPAALSGGQRQRVAMARAIVREPVAFLFDEPLSNLDAKLRAALRLEIRRLHNRLGATSLFVTHDQTEAMTLADRIVIMNGGRIEQQGAPLDVYRHPASRFVATFIGAPAMNMLAGRIAAPGLVEIAGGGRLAFDRERFVVEPGRTVDVGVRPEHLRPHGEGDGDALAFRREFEEELGSHLLVHGITGDAPLIVSSTHTALRSATRVTAEAADVHLFDTASGASLAGPRQPAVAASAAGALPMVT